MVEAAISTPKKLSSSPRSPSPFTPKRSHSVERKRPGTSGSARTTSSSGKTFSNSSTTRSLSVSFQGESFWITVNKAKPTTNNIVSSPNSSRRENRRWTAHLPTSSSSSRGVSPLRLRSGASYNGFNKEPSILSFAVDVKRGRVGENRIVVAHSLRLLHNRLLQWRFVNARADSDLSVQKSNAESCLYDAWASTTKLQESVRAKRRELQLLKHKLKLVFILKKQMVYLEDWAVLDEIYISSLAGAIKALKASTLRLPVVDGATADVCKVKDVICSAMDIMKAMGSSMCLLLPKVGYVNSLVVEVANLSTKEHVLLDECRRHLSMVTTMQVRECSLRSHISQLKCLPETRH
ncbi:hypothetical protein ACSQ67_018517 [Phaseolus vulgaris]